MVVEARFRRRHRLSAGGDGGGVDHISGLHDDVLIQILRRLRCTAAAASTSALSRRWRERGLWRHLPEQSFRGVAHGALESALAQVALPKLSLLDIEITDRLPAESAASLLRAAARLDPVELSLVIAWVVRSDESVPIELPSFARATSITLRLHNLPLSAPAQGVEFPVLERLSITSGSFDTGALISRCPRLRVLELIYCWGIETITVHSATIDELLVISGQLRGVDIMAPMLRKFTLHSDVSVDFNISLLAPMMENLSLKCWSHGQRFVPAVTEAVGIDGLWRLVRLELGTEGSGFILGLDIGRSYSVLLVRNLQEMFPLPKISALELCLDTRGHVYGGVVLHLLRIWNGIRRLKLVIDRDMLTEVCPPDCLCDQPENWRSQNISLMGLEVVEIKNFKGRSHEVDFLKLLFRCAPLAKVTVELASKVEPNSRGCKNAYKLFMKNPAVECHVNLKRGNKVIYESVSRCRRRSATTSSSILSCESSRIGRM
ncbi:hypothetical protein SEVIR_2G404800v4 [Setaria viridis]|uniref:F-box/LRR-repeat protein 15/At3g58940/PEG3-like LRR domain-containing protein n=3 Tax=Setaria viridis TaxID=4556 RepID=A0A4U6W2N6_SETVI|nr:putative FBD-associated F-box protein At5g56390 [Setaria viridis]TKW35885.1 hypothetical protein SEVIR_2G404800v2 [Setaria viridis]